MQDDEWRALTRELMWERFGPRPKPPPPLARPVSEAQLERRRVLCEAMDDVSADESSRGSE